jgi:hypothetical protein
MTEQVVAEVPEIKDPAAVLAALERAKNDAKTYREQLEAKQAEHDALLERVSALEGDEGIKKWKDKTISLSVRSALAKDGVKNVDRVLKHLPLDGIDLDDDGNLTGYSEKLSSLRNDLPELFDVKRTVAGAADLFNAKEPAVKKSGTEIQVEKLFSKV